MTAPIPTSTTTRVTPSTQRRIAVSPGTRQRAPRVATRRSHQEVFGSLVEAFGKMNLRHQRRELKLLCKGGNRLDLLSPAFAYEIDAARRTWFASADAQDLDRMQAESAFRLEAVVALSQDAGARSGYHLLVPAIMMQWVLQATRLEESSAEGVADVLVMLHDPQALPRTGAGTRCRHALNDCARALASKTRQVELDLVQNLQRAMEASDTFRDIVNTATAKAADEGDEASRMIAAMPLARTWCALYAGDDNVPDHVAQVQRLLTDAMNSYEREIAALDEAKALTFRALVQGARRYLPDGLRHMLKALPRAANGVRDAAAVAALLQRHRTDVGSLLASLANDDQRFEALKIVCLEAPHKCGQFAAALRDMLAMHPDPGQLLHEVENALLASLPLDEEDIAEYCQHSRQLGSCAQRAALLASPEIRLQPRRKNRHASRAGNAMLRNAANRWRLDRLARHALPSLLNLAKAALPLLDVKHPTPQQRQLLEDFGDAMGKTVVEVATRQCLSDQERQQFMQRLQEMVVMAASQPGN
ncbi:MAG: hypothetical protein JWP36_1756 [Paucimonas sp.]|nr:hypothetical protein [Paucimonas sp.]